MEPSTIVLSVIGLWSLASVVAGFLIGHGIGALRSTESEASQHAGNAAGQVSQACSKTRHQLLSHVDGPQRKPVATDSPELLTQ
jgi:hypothetical protein